MKRGVLAREIVSTLGPGLDIVAASCRQRPCAHRELRADGSLLCNPVGKSVLAVLNDGFASLVTIVGRARLTRRHWGIVDELKEVFAVARNDGDLLAVLAQSIKLVCVCGLDFFACNVRKLSLSYQGFGFGADEFLFEDDDLGGVGLLVFQLGNLVGNLLLACSVSVCRQQ